MDRPAHRHAITALAAILAITLAACSSSNGVRATGTATTRPAAGAATTTPAAATTVTAPGTTSPPTPVTPATFTIGADGSVTGTSPLVTVKSAPGALPAGQQVTIAAAGDHAPFPDGFTATSDVLDLTVPPGTIRGPLELDFPLPAGPGDPVVLHQTTSATWAIDPATVNGSTITVTTDSFSNRVVGFLSSSFHWGANELTGTTSPCTNTPAAPAWAVTSGPPASGVAHACLISNPDPSGVERAEVQLKSNRAEFLRVTWSGPATPDYVWTEQQDGALTKWIAGRLHLGPNERLLAPGKMLTIGLRRPVGSSQDLHIQFSQDSWTTLASVAQEAAGKVDDLLPMMSVIAACSQGNTSASAFLKAGGTDLTVNDLLGCGFAAIQEGMGQYADHLVDLGRQSIAEGDFTADEISTLSKHVSALRTAGSVIKKFTGTLQAASWVAKSANYFQDALNSFIPDVNVVNVTVVGSKPPATTATPVTTDAPAPTTSAAPVIPDVPNPTKYTDEPDTGPLQIGMHGRRTGVLQTLLISTGDLQGDPDGYFGAGTDRAVRIAQSRHQFPMTGIADDTTMHALDLDTGGATYPSIDAAVAAATKVLTTGNGAGGWMGVDLGNLFQVAQPGLATWSYSDTRGTSADYVLAGDGGVYSTLTIEFIPFGTGYAYDGISSLQGH